MSESGGASVGIIIGAGVGGCALVVALIALVIYCYMKARKENAKPNMTKSHDIFSTCKCNIMFYLQICILQPRFTENDLFLCIKPCFIIDLLIIVKVLC